MLLGKGPSLLLLSIVDTVKILGHRGRNTLLDQLSQFTPHYPFLSIVRDCLNTKELRRSISFGDYNNYMLITIIKRIHLSHPILSYHNNAPSKSMEFNCIESQSH